MTEKETQWKTNMEMFFVPAGDSTPTQLTGSVERDKMAVSVNLIDYRTESPRSEEKNAHANHQ